MSRESVCSPGRCLSEASGLLSELLKVQSSQSIELSSAIHLKKRRVK